MINKLSRKYDSGETYTIEQDTDFPGGVIIRCNGDYITHILFSDVLRKIGIDVLKVKSEGIDYKDYDTSGEDRAIAAMERGIADCETNYGDRDY